MTLSPLLAGYDHLLLDLDGCLWIGEEPIPGSIEAVSRLRVAGKRVCFITNDARSSPEEYVRRLWSMGAQASLEEVVTVGAAIQYELATHHKRRRTFVIGSPAIFRHVGDAGCRIVNGTEWATRAELVVVAGHERFGYEELRIATQAVLAGAEILAAGRDATFPMTDGPWPATGAILAALEYATGCRARSVGKPEPVIFEAALDRLPPGPALVVGDRLDSDLAGAAAAGLDGAIVLSGATERSEAEAAENPAPVAVAEDLLTLVSG